MFEFEFYSMQLIYYRTVSPKPILFPVFSMQNTVDFVNSACNNYHIDSLIIQNIQACLNVQ